MYLIYINIIFIYLSFNVYIYLYIFYFLKNDVNSLHEEKQNHIETHQLWIRTKESLYDIDITPTIMFGN